eukprot:Tamp_03702.p1 GENE.Tamp_03702~~Tamp_03702.p1  ORF type:complete len:1086 (+),score=73.17 Tamp_03702:37-3258(+)
MPTVAGIAVGSGQALTRLTCAPSQQQLSEARALLGTLSLLTEGFETRALLTAAKNVNTLSSKQSGRMAILQTRGLLDGIAAVVRIWFQEEVLALQSGFHRMQSQKAMQDRSGAPGRSRHSQSGLYSMELIDAINRLAKSEDVCRAALASRKFHQLLLRIMSAPAAPIGVRAACAGGLRGMGDAVRCRTAMINDDCVPMLAKLVDSLLGAPSPEHLNLQLDCLMILTCMLDSEEGRAAVLQHASAVMSKVLVSSPSVIAQLTAAAGIALCIQDKRESAYHLIRWAGPEVIVITADVLLRALEEGKFEHSEAGAMSHVVQAMQTACQNSGLYRKEDRCSCDQCGIGNDPRMIEHAATITELSERLNITQRYLATRRSWTPDQQLDAAGFGVNESPVLAHLLGGVTPGQHGRFDALPHPVTEPAHKLFFVASKNGSQVVKRTAAGGGRRRRDPSRVLRNEVLPPPWGPPAGPVSAGQGHGMGVRAIDNADAEQEAMRQIVNTPRMEQIAESMDFTSWGDRKAWHFLYSHVALKSGGLLPRAGVDNSGNWDGTSAQAETRRAGTESQELGQVRFSSTLGRSTDETAVSASGEGGGESGREGGEGGAFYEGEGGNIDNQEESGKANRGREENGDATFHADHCPMSPQYRAGGSSVEMQCECGLCPPGFAPLPPRSPARSPPLHSLTFNGRGSGVLEVQDLSQDAQKVPPVTLRLRSPSSASPRPGFSPRHRLTVPALVPPSPIVGVPLVDARKQEAVGRKDGIEEGPMASVPLNPLVMSPYTSLRPHRPVSPQQTETSANDALRPYSHPGAGLDGDTSGRAGEEGGVDLDGHRAAQARESWAKMTQMECENAAREKEGGQDSRANMGTPLAYTSGEVRVSSGSVLGGRPLSSRPSTSSSRLIWSADGQQNVNLAPNSLITTQRITPTSRAFLLKRPSTSGSHRPSTSESHRRRRPPLADRPSTGDWRAKSTRAQGWQGQPGFDRPFTDLLEGWGGDTPLTAIGFSSPMSLGLHASASSQRNPPDGLQGVTGHVAPFGERLAKAGRKRSPKSKSSPRSKSPRRGSSSPTSGAPDILSID